MCELRLILGVVIILKCVFSSCRGFDSENGEAAETTPYALIYIEAAQLVTRHDGMCEDMCELQYCVN